MAHDDQKSERVAGVWHLIYVALYVVAAAWHFKGALEHWRRAEKK